MRLAAGWLLFAGMLAHVLTLGWGLTAGATVWVLAVRGGLVAAVLTGSTVFLLIWLRMEQIQERRVSIWLRLSVLALAVASVMLMAVSHLRIEHGETAGDLEKLLTSTWLAANWASAALAVATSLATEAAMAGLAWVWPRLPRDSGSDSTAPLDWQRITLDSAADWQPDGSQTSGTAANGSQSESQRQAAKRQRQPRAADSTSQGQPNTEPNGSDSAAKRITIEPNGSGGFRVRCACGWSREKDSRRKAVQSGNAHTKCQTKK